MSISRTLHGGMAMLDAFREFTESVDVPVQHVLVFLMVADRGEVAMEDIIKRVGVHQTAISRAVAKLGPGASPRDPGLGLIEAYEDPEWRRRKLVRITARGKLLAAEMEKAATKFSRAKEGA